MGILNQVKKPKGSYNFKDVGSPEYYLGVDVKIIYCGDFIVALTLFSKTYILQTVRKYQI